VNWVIYAVGFAVFLVVFSGILATELDQYPQRATVSGFIALVVATLWPLVGIVLLIVGLSWMVSQLGRLSISVWERVS
jgi:hypothetical protein